MSRFPRIHREICVLGVTVIVDRKGLCYPNSNPGQGFFILLRINALEEGMNPPVLHSAMSK